jgi:S1/P1 Nuclease
MRHILLALMALFPTSSNARAWGDEGHKVICEIASRLVQPDTRAEIKKLISTDERFNTFSDSCTWPDHPRQRGSEHFLNLPRDSDGLHSESCPSASACVVTAIKKDFEVLSSNNASQAQRLASLKFLGHWVGEISRFTSHSKTIEAETAYRWQAYVAPICIPPGTPALRSGPWEMT